MSPRKKALSAQDEHRTAVATYVAAGGEESVQRVITALYSMTRKLDQWYARQLVDLDLSFGEWSVIAALAKTDGPLTPSKLADSCGIAASSMTHRLDRMADRGLLARNADPDNRTRIQVTLTPAGWDLFVAAVKEANVVETDVLATLNEKDRVRLAELLENVIAGLDAVEDI